MTKIGAIIMASGFSKRFGHKNKLLLPIKGKPLIEVVVSQLLGSGLFSPVVIVTQYDEIEAIYKDNSDASLVRNRAPEDGITTTMKLGIKAIDYVDAYMFVPGDQIGLTIDNLEMIVEAFEKNRNKIIVPSYGGDHGSPKIFPTVYRDDLMNLQGDVGGKQLINKYLDKLVCVDLPREGNLDIDTEACYKKIKGDVL